MAGIRRWLLPGGFIAVLGVVALLMVLDARVRAYLAGPPLGGARIYAAPRTLRAARRCSRPRTGTSSATPASTRSPSRVRSVQTFAPAPPDRAEARSPSSW